MVLSLPSSVLQLPTVTAARYVQPLREGGSLPAVVETEGGGLYVVKFRGAGQGAKALVAELIAGLLAQALALPVPELALVEVPPPFGRSEPDPEIQDILRGSHGINVGARYLDGAFNFDPSAAGDLVSAELAARIVWFDAFLTNPDRTHRNPNILIWKRAPWLIDHGAALYAHHDWASVDEARTRTPFPLIAQHVLLSCSGDLEAADARSTAVLSEPVIDDVLRRLPDALLTDPAARETQDSADAARERYRAYLLTRLRSPRDFAGEAMRARDRVRREPQHPLSARR
ncbi:MAG TPA: HipA family kinase [Gemmatimonadaceae bacterium]|nr:HipA family kinase [Gemmatimonadaceae bacterium]